MVKQEILLESGTNEMELLAFLIGDQPFGINVAKVRTIIKFEDVNLTFVPKAPRSMMGLLLYRDRNIPLIDLAVALNHQSVENNPRPVVILTEFNNTLNCIKVDEVKRIYRVSWEDFVPVSDITGSDNSSIIGSVNVNNEDVMIVDMERILSQIFPAQAMEEISQNTLKNQTRRERANINILIAEDSAMIRVAIKKTLMESGYGKIEDFINGAEAFEFLEKMKSHDNNWWDSNPHLLISDIEMPRMDGLTLCRKIRDDLMMHQLPVIMFSSLINRQMILKCKEVGADGYITKPEINNLVDLVDSLVLI